MTARHFPPFHLERWFAEFEFVSGMRNLAASAPFAVRLALVLRIIQKVQKPAFLIW